MSEEKPERMDEGKRTDDLSITEVDDIKDMTVRELVEMGIMPLNPVDTAKTTDEIIELGKQTGFVYGSALHSLYSAVTRNDLPMKVRVVKATRGFATIFSMLLQAMEVFNKFQRIEEEVLMDKAFRDIEKAGQEKERGKEKEEQ